MIQPYQQRVLEEKVELDKKIVSLDAFICTAAFKSLPSEERIDLREQHRLMNAYSTVLEQRLSRWGMINTSDL